MTKDEKLMLDCSRAEVTKLSSTIALQQSLIRNLENERNEWKRRFDRLLDCCRSVS